MATEVARATGRQPHQCGVLFDYGLMGWSQNDSMSGVENDTVTQIRHLTALPQQTRAFALVVVDGPDSGQRSVVPPLHPTRLLMGKGLACEIRLTDRTVSRRHVAVEAVGHRLRIRDLGSTNGTIVDGLAVVEAFLTGGEHVKIGATTLRVDHCHGSVAPLPDVSAFGRLIGASSSMRRLYPLCDRLAQTNVSLLIEGETGTGKEQLAEALHEQGPRRDGPFIVFDCTAVAPNLIESELFGHRQGAFTGAVANHRGVFERAHGGTLLIDEIGDMPLNLQPKLLRAIERLEVTPMGAEQPRQIDVRVMVATRRDLDHEVQAGRFRDDLFHRIAVVRVELPPLRERRGDVALLARHFWSELCGSDESLPTRTVRRWEDDHWPGNVRELRNAVVRRLALGDLAEPRDEQLLEDHTPGEEMAHPSVVPVAAPPTGAVSDWLDAILALDLPLAATRLHVGRVLEERYVSKWMARFGGDTGRAAAAAGVARRHWQRLVAKLGLTPRNTSDDVS